MNSMCATPTFVMMRGIRRGNLGERSDFSRMIHPDFPNGDFVAREVASSMVCGRPT